MQQRRKETSFFSTGLLLFASDETHLTMQLAIYESGHFETAYTLIRLFDLPGNHITIFADAQTAERLDELLGEPKEKYRWVIQGAEETNRNFIGRMYAGFRSHAPDLLLLGTVAHNYQLHALWLKRLPSMRCILTVHDINSLFDDRLRPGWRNAVRWAGKKLLLGRIKELNVIAEPMVAALRQKTKNKIIHHLPGGIYEGNQRVLPIAQPVKLVVPGTVEYSRRDYRQVFGLLDLAEAAGLALEITLLGSAAGEDGRQVIEKARQYNNGITKIQFYTAIVDQAEFDRQMRSAHFVFAPTTHNSISHDGIPEVYGISKSTGNLYDMIRYARPAIFPRTLSLPANVEAACFRYDQVNEMLDYLLHLVAVPAEYENIQARALACGSNYTPEKIRKANGGLFN